MESFSEIVKQVHNCTTDCCHLLEETEKPIQVLKTRSRTAENKNEPNSDYQEETLKYSFNNSPKVKKNLLKLRKTSSAPTRKCNKIESYYDEIAMYNNDYNLYSSIKRENTPKTNMSPHTKTEAMQLQYLTNRKLRPSTISGDNLWIYAHDYSLSTKNVKCYFDRATKYLEKFRKSAYEAKNKIYLLYNHNTSFMAEKTDYSRISQIYSDNERFGGSNRNPVASISKWIYDNGLQDKKIHLWIITASEIDEPAVLTCRSLNDGINFRTLTVVTISQKKINDSVAFSFMRPGCRLNIFVETAEDHQGKVCFDSRGFDFSKINKDNFVKKYDYLINYVVAMFTIDFKKMNVTADRKRAAKEEAREFIKNLEIIKGGMIEQCQQQKENSDDLTKKSCDLMENIIVRKVDAVIEFVLNRHKNSLSFLELKQQIKRGDTVVTSRKQELKD